MKELISLSLSVLPTEEFIPSLTLNSEEFLFTARRCPVSLLHDIPAQACARHV